MSEEWRTVPSTKGRYQIDISTKEGRCRSLSYRHTGTPKELSNNTGRHLNRIYWTLYIDGVPNMQQAAVWIALTYPERVQNEYFPGAQIDHINTDPRDNRPENLRWVTQKENNNNPLTIKHYSEENKGKWINRKDLSKPVLHYSADGELLNRFLSAGDAARRTGVSQSTISRRCLGYCLAKDGTTWKYVE